MKKFFQLVLSQVTSLFVAFFLLGIFVFFSLLVLIALFQDSPIVVKDDSILVMDLSMSITDAPKPVDPYDLLRDSLDGSPPQNVHLKGLLDTLDRASRDKRIKAIFLHGETMFEYGGSSYASILELRRGLRKFKESGKQVIAYLASPGTRDYLLCSEADYLMLNPYGTVILKGLAAERFYLAGTFEKYGIGIQTTGIGRYKSFGETYTRSNMSDEDREQIEVLAGSLWDTILDEIATSRNLDRDKLQVLTNEVGLFSAQKAMEYGLVDKIAYMDEVLDKLIEDGSLDKDLKSFRQISLREYRMEGKSPFEQMMAEGHPQVAVVYAEGEIVDGKGSPYQVGGAHFSRMLRQIRKNPDVKAVVLRVNSPGGSAFASEVILREVKLLAEDRPVVVSMGGVAASGGYWISSLADYIFVEPATITGSIGVFGMIPNIEEISGDHGVTYDRVKVGRYSDIFSITRPKSDDELQKFKDLTAFIYEQFLDRVAEGRKRTKEEIASIAGGRVWSGIDAVEIGLADELGGLEVAIEHVVSLADLGDKKWKLVQYPQEKEIAEFLSEMLAGGNVPDALFPTPALPEPLKSLKECLISIQKMNDPLGIYARLPYNLTFE